MMSKGNFCKDFGKKIKKKSVHIQGYLKITLVSLSVSKSQGFHLKVKQN